MNIEIEKTANDGSMKGHFIKEGNGATMTFEQICKDAGVDYLGGNL